MTVEHRAHWKRHAPEIRAAESGGATLHGYGAVFNRYSQDMGGWVEQVAPGAFTQTISQADVYGLFNHDPCLLLGSNTAGTMQLAEDVTGLSYDIDLGQSSVARDLREWVERGEIRGSSFSFMALDVEWSVTDQDMPLRILKAVRLFDVGPVTYPAYLATMEDTAQVALRSLAADTGVDVAELVDAAGRRELRSYIGTTPQDQPEPAQHATPIAVAQRRLELTKLGAPSSGR